MMKYSERCVGGVFSATFAACRPNGNSAAESVASGWRGLPVSSGPSSKVEELIVLVDAAGKPLAEGLPNRCSAPSDTAVSGWNPSRMSRKRDRDLCTDCFGEPRRDHRLRRNPTAKVWPVAPGLLGAVGFCHRPRSSERCPTWVTIFRESRGWPCFGVWEICVSTVGVRSSRSLHVSSRSSFIDELEQIATSCGV